MQDPIVEAVKERVDIVDIISNYVTLTKSGANFKGRCPFHVEKTPSFMVNRERQLFRCFGCGESGDVLTFVMKQENIDFPSALKLLAERVGVEIPERNAGGTRNPPGSKDALYAVNASAANLFHQVLVSHPSGKSALEYLRKRGVSDESVEIFQLGIAPSNNQTVRTYLEKKKIAPKSIQEAGSPDRFRNRIMFPFRDVIGHVIGFSGRALGDEMPKYLNTSETPVFQKNKFLYGLYEGKKNIGEAKKVMVVEGQLDLVMAHQSGYKFTVATSGTALSNDHLRILSRYTDTLLFAFDGDAAGKKATARAIHLALGRDFEVQVVAVPEDRDPGDLIANDIELWRTLIEKPLAAIDWLFGYFFASRDRTPTTHERNDIFREIFPYIARQSDTVNRSYSQQRLARLLHVREEAIIEAYSDWKKQQTPSPYSDVRSDATENAPDEVVDTPDERRSRERSLIGLLLVRPELVATEFVSLATSDFTHPPLASLYTEINTWYTEHTNKSPDKLIHAVESTASDAVKRSIQKLIFDTQTYTADFTPEQFVAEYTTLIQMIRKRDRENRIQSFAELIAQAEAAQDRRKVISLMQEMQNLLKTKESHAQENS